MKVLVPGAGGYMGRHVVKELLVMGHEVIASDFKFDGIDSRAKICAEPIFSGDKEVYERFGEPDISIKNWEITHRLKVSFKIHITTYIQNLR